MLPIHGRPAYRHRTGQQTLGLVMFMSAWAIILWFTFTWYGQQLEGRDNPNRDPTSVVKAEGTEVRLSRNNAGHYVANGYINGQAVTFLLDTGATNLSIPMRIAQRLRLRPLGPQQTNTANGVITVYGTQVNYVRIGNIGIRNVAAHINPHMEGDQVLLGMSFLRHVDFAQQGDFLILRQRLKSQAVN